MNFAAYAPNLLAALGVWTLAVITPGPDFVATTRYAIARSRRDGILVALGVACGVAIWVTLSLAGLGFAMTRASSLFATIRLLGALYLMWLGVQALWSAARGSHGATNGQPAESAESAAGGRWGRLPSWLIGFLTNISNPKALAFFGSIFALLLPAHIPLWLAVATGAGMLAISAGWFSLVALLFSLPPISRVYRRAQRWIDAITGGVFVVLGARLAANG